jgi:integrase
MEPFSLEEFEQRMAQWREIDADAAAGVDFMVASALRWEEARVLRVADLQRLPYPAVLVRRAQPEGAPMGPTKNRRHRRVPLPDDVMAWLEERAVGKGAGDLLLPWRTGRTLLRHLAWDATGGGRSINDLRHTGITFWLARGIDTATVRSWAGHADLTTLSRYTHWHGSDSDRAALDRINQARASSGQTAERRIAHQ